MSARTVPAAWAHLPFFAETWPALDAALTAETREILPPAPQTFAALEACAPADVRVLILGQDPYPTPGHAHGLAFSVAPEVAPLPRSLRNIYAEMTEDLGQSPTTGDLRFWARQGVLLLNTSFAGPAMAEVLERARTAQATRIYIGSENRLFALSGSSVIASPFRDRDGNVVGVLGVIGPTRLNYARIVPMVDFTAQSLGRLTG